MNAITLDASLIQAIRGPVDQTFRMLEDRFKVRIVARGEQVSVQADGEGDKDRERRVLDLLEQLAELHRAGWRLRASDVETAVRLVSQDDRVDLKEHFLKGSIRTSARKTIVPKSRHQREYVEAIERHDLVFGIGPAGTGKTYLAVAMGVSLLHEGTVQRILLARPAVEAGERLGFLPGDIAAKVDPYLRPLYDALTDMLSHEKLQRLMQAGVIEIVPLAFMRGRTLARAFVILDEAQNTTLRQMKMFLTRLGIGSRAVVTGDVTQIDLPNPDESGLVRIQPILSDVEGVSFVYFSESDVVRHRLVRDILVAFDRLDHPDEAR